MMKMLLLSLHILALIFIVVERVAGQAREIHPFCFRFTWLGAYQDKNNILGLTCEHIREDLNYIPCRRPLIATHNDEPPDMVNLWQEERHKDPNRFGCPMMPGQLCVKYSYIYNKAVQNITYMCAKVNASEGCYTQKYITGLEVRACVCKSVLGLMPCNAASKIFQKIQFLPISFAFFALVIYNKYLQQKTFQMNFIVQ